MGLTVEFARIVVYGPQQCIAGQKSTRVLGITVKSTWFLSHRVREARKDGSFGIFGGEGKIIEADESYYRNKSIPAPTKIIGERLTYETTGKADVYESAKT